MSETNTLSNKLEAIKKIFKPAQILSMDTSAQEIAKYYHFNRLAYKIVVSRDGFVHMGLSDGDTLKPKDFARPAEEIAKIITATNAKSVLELAAGKGANLEHIGRVHPDTLFYALDLPGGQTNERTFKNLPNVRFDYGDYHDLSRYENASMDIVYIIEALCYAQPKSKVVQEVYRVLKPGGLFVVYDGYTSKRYSEMTQEEVLLVKMGWKGMLVNPEDMYLNDFLGYIQDSGMKIITEVTLDKKVMPSLRMLERHAARFFKYPFLAKIATAFLPLHFTTNAISGYLMPDVVEAKLCTYQLTVAQK